MRAWLRRLSAVLDLAHSFPPRVTKHENAYCHAVSMDDKTSRPGSEPVGGVLAAVVIESWHSTLEFELRALEHFTTEAQARSRVAAWID